MHFLIESSVSQTSKKEKENENMANNVIGRVVATEKCPTTIDDFKL